jgi:hypothetical protein
MWLVFFVWFSCIIDETKKTMNSNPAQFIDVHVFDGKLSLFRECKFSVQEKTYLFASFAHAIKEEDKKDGKVRDVSGIDMVASGCQKPENFDSTHHLYADDILAGIIQLWQRMPQADKKRDLIDMVCEQMTDMKQLGSCPQGRVIRLIQIFNYLEYV